jgi:hypothetical protein
VRLYNFSHDRRDSCDACFSLLASLKFLARRYHSHSKTKFFIMRGRGNSDSKDTLASSTENKRIFCTLKA